MDKSESIRRGEELLRKMSGDSYMKNRAEKAKLLPALNDLILGTVYGDIWNRPGLDKRSRSLCMISLAIAMPELQHNLTVHLRGALVNGVTKEEIIEVILHVAFYTGFPRAWVALGAALDVFKEAGLISQS